MRCFSFSCAMLLQDFLSFLFPQSVSSPGSTPFVEVRAVQQERVSTQLRYFVLHRFLNAINNMQHADNAMPMLIFFLMQLFFVFQVILTSHTCWFARRQTSKLSLQYIWVYMLQGTSTVSIKCWNANVLFLTKNWILSYNRYHKRMSFRTTIDIDV